MKRSVKSAGELRWLFVPGCLFMVLIFLLSRVSAQTPGRDERGQPGVNLAAVSASPDAPDRSARWYRSNAGGMALQETATRFAALSGEYALLIDYAKAGDLPEMLLPYYRSQYIIETHVLYRRGQEYRRQWIFRDAKGVTRLVSVLNRPAEEPETPVEAVPPVEAGDDTAGGGGPDEAESNSDAPTGRAPWGFIEVYNENYRIIEEHMFADDGTDTVIEYTYRGGLLVKAESGRKQTAEAAVKTYTDDYRYNRSMSLRSVERLYHEDAEAVPILLTFPNRVLDIAKDNGDFMDEKLAWNSEFLGDLDVKPEHRMEYTTDARGRILVQSLLDSQDAVVWTIQNKWSGSRLVSTLKTEGKDTLLIEYEYNSRGDRVIERNLRNGTLERLVRAETGGRDVEELYVDGEVILRAIWEDGRKISETRIRRRHRG
jgi:hypothetical protein